MTDNRRCRSSQNLIPNRTAIGKPAAAATLHASGKTDIESSAQAAEALRPIAGAFAEIIFALGIIGTGLVPSSTAAFALSITASNDAVA